MSTTAVAPSTQDSANIPAIPSSSPGGLRLPRSVWLLIAMAVLLVGGTVLVQALTPARKRRQPATGHQPFRRARWHARPVPLAHGRELPRDAGAGVPVQPAGAARPGPAGTGHARDRRRRTPWISPTQMSRISRASWKRVVRSCSSPMGAMRRARWKTRSASRSPIRKTVCTGKTAMPVGVTLARPPVRSVYVQSSPSSSIVVQPALLNDARFLPRATNGNGVVVASLARGSGHVHIIAGDYPVTNAGLPEADNLALVQNLIAGLPPDARIGFDEYHHGFGKGSAIADLALRSPWGWTIIYLAALLLTVFTLNGRRFGKPLAPPPAPAPAPAEFARALSDRWRERGQYAFAQGTPRGRPEARGRRGVFARSHRRRSGLPRCPSCRPPRPRPRMLMPCSTPCARPWTKTRPSLLSPAASRLLSRTRRGTRRYGGSTCARPRALRRSNVPLRLPYLL